MTEAELQDAIADMARTFGWMVAHARPARTNRGWRTPWQYDGKGFPDLTMVRRERLIFAELKAARGRVAPEQHTWLSCLRRTYAEVYVWTPEHWLDGVVDEVLRPEAQAAAA